MTDLRSTRAVLELDLAHSPGQSTTSNAHSPSIATASACTRRASSQAASSTRRQAQRAQSIIFELDGGLTLTLYPRSELAEDAAVPAGPPKSGEFSLGQLVAGCADVDRILEQALPPARP